MGEHKRLLIIGIDGATFDLISPWMENGDLPNLAAIAQNGVSGELLSTLPTNSAAAWTSFMTGMNPGKHGVYGFTRVEPGNGYGIKINTGGIRHAPTIWQILSEQERRSIVINVPMTYPPDPINGLVVTGIDTPGLGSQFTYPPGLRAEIFSIVPNYILDVRNWGVTTIGKRREHLFDDILRMVDTKRVLALHLMTKYPWDLFTIVFTATDRVQHFFWRFLDPDHPLYDPEEALKHRDAILEVYRRIDTVIGEMLYVCGEDTTVIVMSDHGFGPQHKLFRINQWLVENQFLRLVFQSPDNSKGPISDEIQKWIYTKFGTLSDLARRSLSDTAKDRLKRLFPGLRETVESQILFSGIDWSSTLAYHTAEFPGSIRINLKGREVNGIVEPGEEYEAVCDALRSSLEAYQDPQTGQRIVSHVFRRDELYWGSNMGLAPDLILQLADDSYTIDWYMPVSNNGADDALPVIDKLFGKYAANCGSHRLNGILMLKGSDIRKGVKLEPTRIYDVAPTTLYLLGLSIPTEMDGKVLREAIKEELLDLQPVEEHDSSTTPSAPSSSEEALSEEEAEAIAERLRSLGYL